jgi:hypothetical protein
MTSAKVAVLAEQGLAADALQRPQWRMNANLKRGNPRNIRIAAAFVFDTLPEALAAEKRAHQHFAQYRHQKEWFSIAWQVVAEWFIGFGARHRASLADLGNDVSSRQA